jgi:hypothetical protein
MYTLFSSSFTLEHTLYSKGPPRKKTCRLRCSTRHLETRCTFLIISLMMVKAVSTHFPSRIDVNRQNRAMHGNGMNDAQGHFKGPQSTSFQGPKRDHGNSHSRWISQAKYDKANRDLPIEEVYCQYTHGKNYTHRCSSTERAYCQYTHGKNILIEIHPKRESIRANILMDQDILTETHPQRESIPNILMEKIYS